jgi:acyl carrier protein
MVQPLQFETPRTLQEKRLAFIWADLLKIDVDTIGRQSTFFELGGDSLSAIKLVDRCASFGWNFSVKNIYKLSSLCQIANYNNMEEESEFWMPHIVGVDNPLQKRYLHGLHSVQRYSTKEFVRHTVFDGGKLDCSISTESVIVTSLLTSAGALCGKSMRIMFEGSQSGIYPTVFPICKDRLVQYQNVHETLVATKEKSKHYKNNQFDEFCDEIMIKFQSKNVEANGEREIVIMWSEDLATIKVSFQVSAQMDASLIHEWIDHFESEFRILTAILLTNPEFTENWKLPVTVGGGKNLDSTSPDLRIICLHGAAMSLEMFMQVTAEYRAHFSPKTEFIFLQGFIPFDTPGNDER